MFRLKVWYGAILLLALLLVIGSIAANTSISASSTPLPKHPPVQDVRSTFQINQTYVPGNPAIHVHILPGVTVNSPSIPTFSQDDVVIFLNKYGFYAGPVVQGAHLKIVSIQFVTAKQASKLMEGESVGRPDSYLVCYVKVQGPFTLVNVSMPYQSNGKKKTTAKFGDMVFDGHTGNVLVWGIY